MDNPLGDEKLQSDARLMRQVVLGDQHAKRTLIKMLWCRIYSMARHMCPFPDDLEDLTQEVMLEILKSAPRYKADGCVEAWANVVGMRTIIKKLRKTRRRQQTFVSDNVDDYEAARTLGRNVEKEVTNRARRKHVERLLEHLPPKQRAAIVLKIVLGHSVEEVAQIMDKRPDAVRYLLKKARAKLSRLASRDTTLLELMSWGSS